MKTNIFFKKGQSLPLNTIVIAMLVIIVMLVIVVFFTSSVGKSGEQLDKNSASVCTNGNPALKALGYDFYHPLTETEIKDKTSCKDISDRSKEWTSAIGVSNCCVAK